MKQLLKDGINDFIINKNTSALNKKYNGTKHGIYYKVTIAGNSNKILCLRLSSQKQNNFLENLMKSLNQR